MFVRQLGKTDVEEVLVFNTGPSVEVHQDFHRTALTGKNSGRLYFKSIKRFIQNQDTSRQSCMDPISLLPKVIRPERGA